MCGVAGIIGLRPDLAERIAPAMLQALGHRGPDGRGRQHIQSGPDACVTLLHTRLAVLDLSEAGRQPMSESSPGGAPDGCRIVYNGELFNFVELRQDLIQRGAKFRTGTDTEVILQAYRFWGEAAVEKFEGMFAWCLLDLDRRLAWLCRDRLGIKPLYIYRPASGGVLFASEVRAILAAGEEIVPRRLHRTAVESFLAQGAVFGHEAIVEGVELVHPGESVTVDLRGRPIARRLYWQLPAGQTPPISRDLAVRRLSQTLDEITSKHLVSDAPLGLFLSGGIDSQSLAVLATAESRSSLQSITVGFDDKDSDESFDAENVARRLGLRHQTVRIHGSEMLADLDIALASFDQPTVDGFNNFFVARAARRSGLTVALSGLGADELFGGYSSFRDVPRAMRWQSLWPVLTPVRLFAAVLLRTLNSRAAFKAAQLMRRRRGWAETYFLRRELFSVAERREFWTLPDQADEITGLPIDVVQSLESAIAPEKDGINRIARLELLGYMKNMLLRDADAATMASGLELRVPFLDHRLVELVLKLPGDWKRPIPYPKPLLVDALGGRLDMSTVAKKKRGFAFPWKAWLDGPLNNRARDTLHDDETWTRIGFDSTAVRRLWVRYASGDRRILPLQIVALISLSHYVNGHQLR